MWTGLSLAKSYGVDKDTADTHIQPRHKSHKDSQPYSLAVSCTHNVTQGHTYTLPCCCTATHNADTEPNTDCTTCIRRHKAHSHTATQSCSFAASQPYIACNIQQQRTIAAAVTTRSTQTLTFPSSHGE